MDSTSGASLSHASELAVIGAGPIGLEAAALAASYGIQVHLFERRRIGEHIRQWGQVRLFTPFRMNHSTWGPRLLRRFLPDLELPAESEYLTGGDYVNRYLEPLARLPLLEGRLRTSTEVVQIARDGLAKRDAIGQGRRRAHPFRLLLRSAGGEHLHRAWSVIDASGVYGSPQFMGNGNIPAPGELQARRESLPHLCYGVADILGRERARFANRRTLLVGGGHSAATALEAFQELMKRAPETWVAWVTRSPDPEPYQRYPKDPLPCRDALSRLGNRLAQQPPAWLRYFGGTWVEALRRWPRGGRGDFQLLVRTPRREEIVECDAVVAAVGFAPDNSIYRQLQIHECYATAGPMKLAAQLLGGSSDCLAQDPQGLDTLSNPEPGFFILGNKSYGTNSTFLLSHGFEQIELVVEHLRETFAPCQASTAE